MFTSELIKKAWQIRKAAAERFGCRVSEIAWGLCLQEAKKGDSKMIGSAKQIKWAEDIREDFSRASKELKGHTEAMDKAVAAIESIEYAEFWIDTYASEVRLGGIKKGEVVYALRLLAQGKLRYKGPSHKAYMAADVDGNVTYK